ncbi:MAG TPA: histidine phosphatase family protein [Acidimicrobiales bacterium]|nr:histidine phosphatase family protein [Acidimicrobiales bacterium]
MATTRDDAPAYLLRYATRRSEPAPEPTGDETAPAFVVRARERSIRRALAELDQPAAPPGRTEAFARETVAPREFQWPEAIRRRAATSIEVRLIRHGQTQGYIADSALTPLGRWQAHRKGQDLAKGLTEGAVARIVHGPAARTEETAVALAEGMRQAVARYGIHDVTVTEPEPIDAFRNFQAWFEGRELDITAAFHDFASVLEGYERHGGGDRPGWMVELDRIWRIQFAGGDPITLWLSVPTHYAEPPALVVRRYWQAMVDEVRDAPAGTRLYVCAHSGPLRAVAAAAVGHDPGEPQNVEDVRIRIHSDLEHATLTYRGRAVEMDIPTTITPSWCSAAPDRA